MDETTRAGAFPPTKKDGLVGEESDSENRSAAICVLADLHLGSLLFDWPAFEQCVQMVCDYLEQNTMTRISHLVLVGETVDEGACLPGQALRGLTTEWQVDLAAKLVLELARRVRAEHVTGVVGKHPSKTNPRPFLIKLVRGVPTRPDFASDALHILGLSKSNATAAGIVGNIPIRGLDMSDPRDRRTFNDVVEQLIQAGFDGRLGTYEFVAGSYYWWLLPGRIRQLSNFIRQRRRATRRVSKTVRKKAKRRRRKQLPP